MAIELTEQQSSILNQLASQSVEFVDPQTNRIYVLIARETCEPGNPKTSDQAQFPSFEIPEGIRRSQEAMRRELPGLLKQKASRPVGRVSRR